jgi:hypothetical protein
MHALLKPCCDSQWLASEAAALNVWPACRPYAEKYAEDQDAFFADYAASHAKLSELGVQWEGEPVTL